MCFCFCLQEYEAIYLARLTIKMMSPIQLGRSFSIQAGTTGCLPSLFHTYSPRLALLRLDIIIIIITLRTVKTGQYISSDYTVGLNPRPNSGFPLVNSLAEFCLFSQGAGNEH